MAYLRNTIRCKRFAACLLRILTMGLAFVVVPFLPASNVFFRVGFVVAERVLYLSSIGSCLLTVLGFTLLSKFPMGKKVSKSLVLDILEPHLSWKSS